MAATHCSLLSRSWLPACARSLQRVCRRVARWSAQEDDRREKKCLTQPTWTIRRAERGQDKCMIMYAAPTATATPTAGTPIPPSRQDVGPEANQGYEDDDRRRCRRRCILDCDWSCRCSGSQRRRCCWASRRAWLTPWAEEAPVRPTGGRRRRGQKEEPDKQIVEAARHRHRDRRRW